MNSFLIHPALSDCHHIFLRNFEIICNIDVHDFEKHGEQRVLFNVDLYIPLSDSKPKQDQLQEVVDYDFIRDTIRKRVMQGHIQLQETLCDDIAKLLVAHPKVKAVVISTQKPDVYPDCDTVGVEIMRFKESPKVE